MLLSALGLKNCDGQVVGGGIWRGRHQMQRECAAAAATERALWVRKGQSANASERGLKKCGRYVVRSGQKRAREVNR